VKPIYRLPLAFLLLILSPVGAANSELRGLYLTSPGIWHDYQSQAETLTSELSGNLNIRFDVSLAEHERWTKTDFSSGYDVLVYNICIADNQEQALIANMRRQTETLGIPALVIHCTMHSFRETDLWWPFLGLQTKAHEHGIQSISTKAPQAHPMLTGIEDNWTVAEDELYINLQFVGESLLVAKGEDGKDHVVAWLNERNGKAVFGTTLGHTDTTIADPQFQQLLTNAILFLTGRMTDEGMAKPGSLATPNQSVRPDQFSVPEGVGYLDSACAQNHLSSSIGLCYAGCVANPVLWGDEAEACKNQCVSHGPGMDEYQRECTQ
jgi:hypothetical protein